MRKSLFLVALIFLADGTAAQQRKEPAWSIMVLTVAAACGGDPAKVDLAAGFIADWVKVNNPSASGFSKADILNHIKNDREIKDIVKQKGAFVKPCESWRQMLDIFVQSKGSVMSRVQ